MYFIKYNDIILTDLIKIQEVELPPLPSIEHTSIDIYEMDGNVFNSLTYNNKEITIRFIIQPQNPSELNLYVNDVKRAFNVKSPQPLFLEDESKYILAVTEDLAITPIGVGTAECEVTLIAYNPHWIDVEVQNVQVNNKTGYVTNNGDVSTTPIIMVGIQNDTTFVQLENKNTKERILVGEMPSKSKPQTIKDNDTILFDNCNSTSGWVSTTTTVEGDLASGGTISTTSDGGGLCIGAFGSGSGTWKGASYRKNLDRAIKDFKLRANFSFHSAGINGDPSRVEYKDFGSDNESTIQGGSVTYSYKVTTQSSNLNVRTGAGTNYARIGGMPKGTVINGVIQEVNGWLKHNHLGRTGYSSMQYITKTANDSRWSATVCNYVTNTATQLRSSADENSSSKCTVPSGTVVRCYTSEEGEGTKFRKLYTNYNGKSGYIKSSDLTRASEAGYTITYELQGETADDKTGKIGLYGYSSNGVQLFSMSLTDESEWYEATYPLVKKNGQEFLKDTSFSLPPTKTKEIRSESGKNVTVKYENMFGGEYGSWNDCNCDMYLERVNNYWYCWVKKVNGKSIYSSKVYDTTNSDQSLAYVILYIGTATTDSPSAMSLNELEILAGADIKPAEQNILRFKTGDVIEIDCGIPAVKLNDRERNDLVDIGSQFFDLEVGENELKIASDDNGINFTVLFNEKYL